MGTPGVPWNVDREAIVEALKRQHGRLTYACKDLGCKYDTLKKHIDQHPDLQEILDQCRNQFDTTLLDTAESVLMKGMLHEDIGQALKASFYVLNNKGKPRGYSPKPPEAIYTITCSDLPKKYQEGEIRQPD